MDVTSIATSLIAGQAQVTAASVASIVLKTSADSQKAIADMLLASSTSVNTGATLASHLGTNLDVTA